MQKSINLIFFKIYQYLGFSLTTYNVYEFYTRKASKHFRVSNEAVRFSHLFQYCRRFEYSLPSCYFRTQVALRRRRIFRHRSYRGCPPCRCKLKKKLSDYFSALNTSKTKQNSQWVVNGAFNYLQLLFSSTNLLVFTRWKK